MMLGTFITAVVMGSYSVGLGAWAFKLGARWAESDKKRRLDAFKARFHKRGVRT